MAFSRLMCAMALVASLMTTGLLAQGGAGNSQTQVNLNTATSAELERLPGVGPATAARIIEYREKNGGFKKIEELMNIQGIGEKRFLDLKGQLVVTPPKASQAAQ